MTNEQGPEISRICRDDCHHWQRDEFSLHHESRRYFSVVFIDDGSREHVMIDQPEIGILGFVVAGTGHERRWLMQHKPEPGNVGFTQWAPTVQATRSNFERVHHGRATPYLGLFLDPCLLLEDVAGSEQGDRFLNKFNRNSKHWQEAEPPPEGCPSLFTWVSSAELKARLRESYKVNTDARSVVASGSWHLLADDPQQIFLGSGLPTATAVALNRSYHAGASRNQTDALQLLERVHRDCPRHYRRIPIRQLRMHTLLPDGIYDAAGHRVCGYFDCHMPVREVARWQQPLIERDTVSQHVLLFAPRNGVALFHVSAYPEVGFHDRAEFGPTLQSGDSRLYQNPATQKVLSEEAEIILEIHQSDEGGRFYRNIGHYAIARWHGDPAAWNSPNGCWLTLADLESLSRRKGVLTNEMRTLLSLLLSLA